MARPAALPERIRQLTPLVANQIAAGEVVERPASVLKELIENSLDAGAGCIDVVIERAGSRLIQVRDDGVGIHPDDLCLVLDRHATSKLREVGDLAQLRSLGFRGEALPSIGSVSRFRLSSRAANEPVGWQISTDGVGLQAAPVALAHPPGTTVEVRDLFFNTPARRRFLRTDKTEFAHLLAVFNRLALSRPDVGFTLRHNGKSVAMFPATAEPGGRTVRLVQVCGRAFMNAATELNFEAAGMELRGWVAEPAFARRQSDIQYFFINGRPIRDRLVTHAIRQVFDAYLQPGCHPAYVLYLELPMRDVDINVNPTKTEVRFRQGRMVHDFLVSRLAQVLAAADGSDAHNAAERVALSDGATGTFARPSYRSELGSPRIAETPRRYDAVPPVELSQVGSLADPADCPLGRALAQCHHDYIVAQNRSGLVLVDVRSAQREVIAGRLRRAWQNGGLRARPLLLPEPVSVSEAAAQVAEDNEDVLRALSFNISRVGPSQVIVREVPTILGDSDPTRLTQALLAHLLASSRFTATADEVSALFTQLAMQCAVPGAGNMDTGRMNALLRELEAVLGGRHGPWIQISLSELQQRLEDAGP